MKNLWRKIFQKKKIKEAISPPTVVPGQYEWRHKLVSPQIYGMVFDTGKRSFVQVTVAYSLEDARRIALSDLIEEYPDSAEDLKVVKVKMYHQIDAAEVLDEYLQRTPTLQMTIIDDKPEMTEIGSLMQRIIVTKSKKLYKENKSKFSKEEQKLIEDSL